MRSTNWPRAFRKNRGPRLAGSSSLRETAAPVPGEAWRRVQTLAGGTEYHVLRGVGACCLFVYLPRERDGTAELSLAATRIRNAGYDILTARLPENADTTLREESAAAIYQLGLKRPGYSRRFLAVHGRALAGAVRTGFATAPGFQALIVFRPGDAWGQRGELRKALPALPESLRLLWVPSTDPTEVARANTLRWYFADAPAGKQLSERPLAALSSRVRADFTLPISESFVYFLLLERQRITWVPAFEVFPRGCARQRSGRMPVSLRPLETSAGRDRDFCPLFLRRKRQLLYRAEEVGSRRCGFRVEGGTSRIYCFY